LGAAELRRAALSRQPPWARSPSLWSCPALCRASTNCLSHLKTWMAGTSPAMTALRKYEDSLARALELIGGGHLAQEVLHRVAELLGLARKIAADLEHLRGRLAGLVDRLGHAWHMRHHVVGDALCLAHAVRDF